jgi:DNA-binding MarR family transcriptional regulator
MPSSVGIDTETAAAFSAALDDFMRATRRAKGRLGADAELSLSQYHLLEPLLDSAEPMGVRALAGAAAVSPPTVTRMLVGLVREGLVERASSVADRRVVHVALTDFGRDRVLRKRAGIEARRRQIFESLTAGERREAARLLARLAAAIEELR